MWLLLLVAMLGNGAFRTLALQPFLGEDRARQLASVSGSLIVLALTRPFVARIGRATSGQLLGVGLLWLLLTIGFEFLLGRYVSDLSWQAMVADYDITRGRLWPLVLVTTFLAPWIWGRSGA